MWCELMKVMRTYISPRHHSGSTAERGMTTDGPRGPVNAAAKHVNLKGVRTCNMAGSAPVDDGRGGQPDHRGKRALSCVTITLAFIFWTPLSPLKFAQLLNCCLHRRLADQFIFGKNMKTWREGLER